MLVALILSCNILNSGFYRPEIYKTFGSDGRQLGSPLLRNLSRLDQLAFFEYGQWWSSEVSVLTFPPRLMWLFVLLGH